MLVADQGADVVKVESPEGDPLRGTPVFAVWNRGKRSVVAGHDEPGVLDGIVRGADAIIEAFLSGRNTYGIDTESARSIRPDVVHLTLPGFGDEHTQAATPGTELLISAATGVYTDRSQDGSEGASFLALPYASIFGAMVAAPALAAALFHRERTGEGQDVKVPLYDAMFTAMGSAVVSRPDVEAGPGAISPAIARFYRCLDGRWINLNATYERSLRPILDVLGHPDWFGPLTDPRLRLNLEEREEWAARFAEPWLERPAQEWESLMADAGVPLTMCRTLREWMETEHAIASGAVVDVEDHEFGPMRQVGIQVRLSHTPGEVRASAPMLGQHNETILAESRVMEVATRTLHPHPNPLPEGEGAVD
jgi:crotonobetainyl-CoA:carnitine CoA-transferase CaiB-like acyl-CoA transferase